MIGMPVIDEQSAGNQNVGRQARERGCGDQESDTICRHQRIGDITKEARNQRYHQGKQRTICSSVESKENREKMPVGCLHLASLFLPSFRSSFHRVISPLLKSPQRK